MTAKSGGQPPRRPQRKRVEHDRVPPASDEYQNEFAVHRSCIRQDDAYERVGCIPRVPSPCLLRHRCRLACHPVRPVRSIRPRGCRLLAFEIGPPRPDLCLKPASAIDYRPACRGVPSVFLRFAAFTCALQGSGARAIVRAYAQVPVPARSAVGRPPSPSPALNSGGFTASAPAR